VISKADSSSKQKETYFFSRNYTAIFSESRHSGITSSQAYTGVACVARGFRGVREQRKTEEQDFRCFARTKNGARAKKRRGEREGEEGSFVPLPHSPLSFFGSRPIFRAGKKTEIPFLGLSLLPNPTETLATQDNTGGNRELDKGKIRRGERKGKL